MKVVFAIVILAGAGVCVRLGFWQLSRLEERREFNALVEARMSSQPVDLESGSLEDAAFKNAVASGTWDIEHAVVVVGRVSGGRLGAHVVVPLRLSNGNAVLVNLGWLESSDGSTPPLPPADVLPDTVRGFLRLLSDETANIVAEAWPLRVRTLNVREISSRLSYPLLGYVLIAEAVPGFEPVVRPPLSDGPHLSYAFQWFAFALVALIGTFVVVTRGTH